MTASLKTLNNLKPGPGNWPSQIRWAGEEIQALYDICDAEFAADVTCHEEFERLQPLREVQPHPITFDLWRRRVERVALRYGMINAACLYPTRCVAWALLDTWIKCRLTDIGDFTKVPFEARQLWLRLRGIRTL